MSEDLGVTDTSIPLNEVLAQHADGSILAVGRNYGSITGAGNLSMLVRVPDLGTIRDVISVKIRNSSPATYWQAISGFKWSGNVVGFTIYQLNAGSTLQAEVYAVGSP